MNEEMTATTSLSDSSKEQPLQPQQQQPPQPQQQQQTGLQQQPQQKSIEDQLKDVNSDERYFNYLFNKILKSRVLQVKNKLKRSLSAQNRCSSYLVRWC